MDFGNSTQRKNTPVVTGVLDYFPLAIAALARVSQKGNDKHNPGEPLRWSRDKSCDHADCIGRHLMQRDQIDPEDGELHAVHLAWRAMALAELALEKQAERQKDITLYSPGAADAATLVRDAADGDMVASTDPNSVQVKSFGGQPPINQATAAVAAGGRVPRKGDQMKTIYISGPMRGFPDLNFPAFDAARDIINARGDKAISPADLDRKYGHCSLSREYATRDTLAILHECNGLYLLDGWEWSDGAAAEFFLARWIADPESDFTFETPKGLTTANFLLQHCARAYAGDQCL